MATTSRSATSTWWGRTRSVEYLYNLLDFYLSIFNIPFACRHKIDIWPGANPSSAACASISTLRQRPRHFRLGQQRAPFTVEALESAAGNTGNTDNYLAPPNHFPACGASHRCQEISGGKGAKGGNPSPASCSALSAPVRRTVAWRKPADTPRTTFHRETVRNFCVSLLGSTPGCSPHTPPQNR